MLSELFQTGILVALVTFTCTRIAARMENTSTLRPFSNTDWDFKDYIKKFDASAVRDRIEKMRKAKGFNVTTQEYINNMFDGMDAAEELLKLQVKAGDVRLLLDKDGRRWEPPPGFTEEQNDRFNLRPRIFELMKQAIYQARNKMVMMQILRKKYSGSSLYKMGYLFSKTDTACKTFAQFAYRAIRHCGLGKTGQTERVYLIDVLEIEERLVNLWFTVELLVDLIVKNDILCKDMLKINQTNRKIAWKFVP